MWSTGFKLVCGFMVSWCFMLSTGLIVCYGRSSQVNAVTFRHAQGTKPRRWLKNQRGNKTVVEESKMQQGGGWRIKDAPRRWLKNQKELTQTIKTGCCASKPSPAAGAFETAAKNHEPHRRTSNRRMDRSDKGISWIASLERVQKLVAKKMVVNRCR